MEKTYYLGLSMAGTVSAGTYTAGCLIELDNWLKAWRNAANANQPVKLIAQVDHGPYKKHDIITLDAAEIPKHEVKITTMTGSSGGGVSATLYAIGLATDQVEHFLRDTWMGFDIDDMLNTGDIQGNAPKAASILNVLPIEKVINQLKALTWGANNLLNVDYMTDHIELYQTLSNYEAIPYNLVYYQNQKHMPGTFHNHFDYVRYSLAKTSGPLPDSGTPYRYDLEINPGTKLANDLKWQVMLQSTPATGAFPIGFRPREVDRLRAEYDGKMFYLKYSIPGSEVDYDKVNPNWIKGPNTSLKMKYFDGGTFDDEPHDLARASILRYLNNVCGMNLTQLPNKGNDTFASVILINPFPTHRDATEPGTAVPEIPNLFQQPPLLIGALMDQGRFHPEWIEKLTNEQYYSRFLISPSRPNASGDSNYMLAGATFGAFGGFLDQKYREHDYELGHYNTYKFLFENFAVPENNVVVDYYHNADQPTKDKYRALGWVTDDIMKDKNGKDETVTHVQIIPCFVKHEGINYKVPDWPVMGNTRWQSIRQGVLTRSKMMIKNLTGIGSLLEDLGWLIIGKEKVNEMLDAMEKVLKEANLL